MKIKGLVSYINPENGMVEDISFLGISTLDVLKQVDLFFITLPLITAYSTQIIILV